MACNDMAEPEAKRLKSGHFQEHFTDPEVDNQRIREVRAIMSPQLLIQELPLTKHSKETVLKARQEASRIVRGEDDRLLVIVGPCSIHDPEAAFEYAGRLKSEMERFQEDLFIVMRVFFEKPRTTVGWKGLINDPALDDSFMVNTGLRMSRKLLQRINSIGVSCGVEFLDSMTPQYISDLVSWGVIGSRTAESQLHRELASGLSMPIAFKNGSGGDVDVAIEACQAAMHPHCFFSISKQGTSSIVHSYGNSTCSIVLRGGKQSGSNYEEEHVKSALCKLGKHPKLCQRLMVDCAQEKWHKDSKAKGHEKIPQVAAAVGEQLRKGQKGICGVMLDSNLFQGSQKLPVPEAPDFGHRNKASAVGEGTGGDVGEQIRRGLRYGTSISDPCIDWYTTVRVLEGLAEAVRARRMRPSE